MMLLLDVGNTSINWVVHENGKTGERGCLDHHDRDLDSLASDAWGRLPIPHCIAVANVAGQRTQERLAKWAERQWGISPCFLRSTKTVAGVTNAYADPASLGVDRWASLVAAHHEYSCGVCIIDCGTAITIDVIGSDGYHKGGLITPGIGLLLQTLLEETSEINAFPAEEFHFDDFLGKSTQEGVEKGVAWMACSLINTVVADVMAQYPGKTEVVITGGYAGRILPMLKWQPLHDPDLVLKGVAILAMEANCDK